MRQSSRDAAAGRMEVWIDNDTSEDVTPTRITYVDGRFRTPLTGERLREIPAQSTRGFQFPLPSRPTCGASNDVEPTVEDPLGTVEVEYAGTDRDAGGRRRDRRGRPLHAGPLPRDRDRRGRHALAGPTT